MGNSTKILFLTLTSFVVGTSQFVLVGILDQVAQAVGVSVAAAGQLVTVFALANAVGTPVVILLTSRLGAKNQLLVALGSTALGIGMMLAIPTFVAMLLARAIMGIGTGVFVVTAYSVAARLAPPGKQGSAMSNIAMGFSAALVLGLPIGRIVTAAFNWTAVFWGIGALVILALVATGYWIKEPARDGATQGEGHLFQLKQPAIWASLLVTFFLFVSYSSVNTYVSPLLGLLIHPNDQTISLVLLLLGLSSLLGSKIGGALADRLGITATLLGGILVQGVSLTLIYLIPITGWGAVTLLMLWALSAWICGPTLNLNLVSTAPKAASLLLSLNSTFVQVGFAVGAVAGGVAIQRSPTTAITGIGTIFAFLSLTVAVSVVALRHRSVKERKAQ